MNLPISMNPSDYGDIIVDNYIQINGENFHRFIVVSGNRTYQIDVIEGGMVNHVTILGSITLSWTDTKISTENGSFLFSREIGKSTILFLDGIKVLRKKLLNAKPFRKEQLSKSLDSNFITMDIETVKVENKISPYLICAYNGENFITSYANESLVGLVQQKDLFNNFINKLLTFFNGRSNLTIYAHNLSGFDGIFLLKHILPYGKVKPLIHNDRLISIKVLFTIEGYIGKTIAFKDSYLLLPLPLRKLCSAFGVTTVKGFFPFKLTDILYNGVFPKFEYWTGISLTEFNGLVKAFSANSWNFKDDAIKYCKLDCKCLFEILVKFNELIFNHFKVNINLSLTLPALAMRIYKSQFMPANTIYQLLGRVESEIRQSYTGGAVDVFIPHNSKETFFSKFLIKLYSYDVNSLYPFIMADTPMPVGKPIFFEGDIRKIESDALGFFYCKITSPDYLEHPILQRRIQTSDGLRTIAGLGGWEGWIFSGEMDNAMKYGYTFEILKGYQFKKGYIFKEYVNKMYNLRLEFEKGHAMNLIAKLLMNSLYGKFGMNLDSTTIEMFDTSSESGLALFNDMLDVYDETVEDFIKIDNFFLTIRKSLVNYFYNEDEDMFYGVDVNIAIASAITGGARMWMSVLKNNPLFKLFYSDTDNVVVDRPLPSFMVGNELGQFKLEHVIERAVFLAPKVYGLITSDGKEIIKVKGINQDLVSDIHIQDLEKLMYIDTSKEFTQEKWFKKVIEGEITVNEVAYTLKVTSNKRKPVYVNNVFENTKPYNYDEIIKKD